MRSAEGTVCDLLVSGLWSLQADAVSLQIALFKREVLDPFVTNRSNFFDRIVDCFKYFIFLYLDNIAQLDRLLRYIEII